MALGKKATSKSLAMFSNEIVYFVTATSYTSKMFMKLTLGLISYICYSII